MVELFGFRPNCCLWARDKDPSLDGHAEIATEFTRKPVAASNQP
jgi:hypothetical protein